VDLAEQWFSQSVFAGMDIDTDLLDGGAGAQSDSEEEEEGHEGMKIGPVTPPRTPKGSKRKGGGGGAGMGMDDSESDWVENRMTPKRRKAAEESFEEVAVEEDRDSDDESSSDSDMGSDSDDSRDDFDRAEDLALAKKMLSGKEKHRIVDAAYNRYNFHDTLAPTWFSSEERKFMKPQKHVSKAEMEEQKDRLRAVDARPIKKVAEAKARKKTRISRALERAKLKAGKVAEQDELDAKSRMREIQRIYAKAQSTVKKQKGVKGKDDKKAKVNLRDRGPAKGPKLDSRMFADKRGKKAAEKRKGGKSKSSGKGKKSGKGGKASRGC
jgi:AdoMet-dependent rRNA methyltransferase SPB1